MEIIAPLGEVSKNDCILHRKWVDFMTCKIYFNRVAFKKPVARSKLIVQETFMASSSTSLYVTESARVKSLAPPPLHPPLLDTEKKIFLKANLSDQSVFTIRKLQFSLCTQEERSE